MGEDDGGQDFSSLLAGGPLAAGGAEADAWAPGDFDFGANELEGLHASNNVELVGLFDGRREDAAERVVVATDELHDFVVRGEAHGLEHHDDGDVFADRVVLEVDLVVFGLYVGLGLAFEGGGGHAGLGTLVGAPRILFHQDSGAVKDKGAEEIFLISSGPHCCFCAASQKEGAVNLRAAHLFFDICS